MDSYGNVKLLALSSTNFMGNIVKTSVKAFDLIEQYRMKKL